MTPGSWLIRAVRVVALLSAVTAVSVLACVLGAWPQVRVPYGAVTGPAAAAVGDSGIFASPILPRGARPVIPLADAESAAVAYAYRGMLVLRDRSVRYSTVPYEPEIRRERRRVCGRAFYFRPFVAMPDTNVVRTSDLNMWTMWSPAWLIPICDAAGVVRASVYFPDVRIGARVIQGPDATDVPELVADPETHPLINEWSEFGSADWERGIKLTPETAVATVAALLGQTGARVADIPEAFASGEEFGPEDVGDNSGAHPKVFLHLVSQVLCPRWRLTLDRSVTLRGSVSGQVIHTQTVYVGRSKTACFGSPQLQIPKPMQPATVAFTYDASWRPFIPRGYVGPYVRDLRWAELRVLEPVWFEEARVER